jgi:hypothetical protein
MLYATETPSPNRDLSPEATTEWYRSTTAASGAE